MTMNPVLLTAARTVFMSAAGLNASGAGDGLPVPWPTIERIQAAWRASTGWIEIAALRIAGVLMLGAWPW